MDRSLSMPTPLDRSLSLLTPPSSASTTNGDYWSANGLPLSDTHARSHSLPGTPATTPPAPAYMNNGMQQQQFISAYSEPRASSNGNRYGQQPDMQRLYHHSRNTSLMSYQDEEMSTASSAPSVQSDAQYAHAMQQMHNQHSMEQNRFPAQGPFPSIGDRPYGLTSQASAYAPAGLRHNAGTQGHHRTHSRGQSKSSLKVFNTPNLTTQLNRRTERTPNPSPAKVHSRQGSNDTSNHASLWVQQQQQIAYHTPQQSAKSHSRQQSVQLPQIYEETPSCRMAYQLHGQGRGSFVGNGEINPQHDATGSPRQPLGNVSETTNSPLNGKKRDRVVSASEQYYPPPQQSYEDRQESLTPPPIPRVSYEESPKRRRSIRTGMHSRSGSVFEY